MTICKYMQRAWAIVITLVLVASSVLFAAPAVAHADTHYVPSDLARKLTPSAITPRGTTPWGDPCFDGIAYVDDLEEAYQYGTIKMLELDPDKMVVEYINTDVLVQKQGTWQNTNISDYTFTTLFYRKDTKSHNGKVLQLRFKNAGFASIYGGRVDILITLSNIVVGYGSHDGENSGNPFIAVGDNRVVCTAQHQSAADAYGQQTAVDVTIQAVLPERKATEGSGTESDDGSMQYTFDKVLGFRSLEEDCFVLRVSDLDQPAWHESSTAFLLWYSENVLLGEGQRQAEPTTSDIAGLPTYCQHAWSFPFTDGEVAKKGGVSVPTIVDADENGYCDRCNKRFVCGHKKPKDKNKNGFCDKCHGVISASAKAEMYDPLPFDKDVASDLSTSFYDWHQLWLRNGTYIHINNALNGQIQTRGVLTNGTADTDLNGFSVRTDGPTMKYTWSGDCAGTELLAVGNRGGESYDPPKLGRCELIKSSTKPGWVSQLNTYSLEGAKYGVWVNKSELEQYCKGIYTRATYPDQMMVTDANGKAVIEEMQEGRYYVAEIEPSIGHGLDNKTYTIDVKEGKTTTIRSTEPALFVDTELLCRKNDWYFGSSHAHGDSPFAGNVFTTAYWDQIASSTPSGSAKSAVSMITRADGYLPFAKGTIVGGSWPWTDNGRNVLPVGTYTLEETRAANGYDRNTNRFLFNVSVNSEGNKAQLVELGNNWEEGEDVAEGAATTGWTVTQPDCWWGGLKIQKIDADLTIENGNKHKIDLTWPGPQGNALLSGAVFSVYNASAEDIYAFGKVIPTMTRTGDTWNFKPESKVCSLITDANGRAATAANALPYGTYILVEETPPSGYLVNEAFAQGVQFSVHEDGGYYIFDGYGDFIGVDGLGD